MTKLEFDPDNHSFQLTMNNDDEWRRRLCRHHQKLLAAVVATLLAYFAALIAVCYFALRSHWN
jgi:hypothetical protein